MTTHGYSASITAPITAQEAIQRISRVNDWWTAGVTGASEHTGDAFTVRWGDTFVDFAVTQEIPARKIVWLVTDCNLPFTTDKKEWKNTEIVFDIFSDRGATTVKMTHAGLHPAIECYEACSKGWNFFITESLQHLLTENQGMPDRITRQQQPAEELAATR